MHPPIWKAIEKAREVVQKGAGFIIGDGESVDVWLDLWVPWIKGFIPSLKDESYTQSDMKVSQIINHELPTWRTSLVLDIFNPMLAQGILSIPIPARPSPNKLMWIAGSKSLFSVKSAYRAPLPGLPLK